jgi:predicted nucleic acid-binding protein
VLSRPELKIRKGLQRELIDLITSHAHAVNPIRHVQVTQGPDHNLFLEFADSARADYLVTGNQRHFPKFWKQTKVVASREFLNIVAPHLLSRN